MLPILLASSSPYRRQLLARLGLNFESRAPDLDETPLPGEDPELLVRRLAEAKARALGPTHPDTLIIGSDQVAVLDGQILGKPGNHERAREQLSAASGRELTFLTGLCLYHSGADRARVRCERFRVEFRTLKPEHIEHYLRREQPYDCAGSFKAEGLGIGLFKRLSGDDPNTLVGLPLIALVDLLVEEGVDVLLASESTTVGARTSTD